jgi:hypothetical protein
VLGRAVLLVGAATLLISIAMGLSGSDPQASAQTNDSAVRSTSSTFGAPVIAWCSTNGIQYDGKLVVSRDGLACVLSHRAGVYAYGPDGVVRWTYGTGIGLPLEIAAGAGEGLFVLDDLRRVHRLDAEGRVLWITELDGPPSANPSGWGRYQTWPRAGTQSLAAMPDGGVVVMGPGRGIRCVGRGGERRWIVHLPGDPLHIAVPKSGDVFVTYDPDPAEATPPPQADNRDALSRISPSGEVLWTRPVGGYTDLLLSPTGRPIVRTDEWVREVGLGGSVERDPGDLSYVPFGVCSDGRWLVLAEGGIYQWDGTEWSMFWEGRESPPEGALPGAHSTYASLGPDDSVYLTESWDVSSESGPQLRLVTLTCLDPTGERAWEVSLPVVRGVAGPITPSPDGALYALVDGILLRLDDPARVADPLAAEEWHRSSLSALGYEEAWRVPAPGEPSEDEIVRVGASGRIYAFLHQPDGPAQDAVLLRAMDPQGSVLWEQYWGDFVLDRPTVVELDDASVWLRVAGRLYRIPSDGGDRWRVRVPSSGEPGRTVGPSRYSPVLPLDDGAVAFATGSEGVVALAPTGEVLWRALEDVRGCAITSDGGLIYAAAPGRHEDAPWVVALTPQGEQEWVFSAGAGGVRDMAAMPDGGVVVTAHGGIVRYLSSEGDEVWRLRVDPHEPRLGDQFTAAPPPWPDNRPRLRLGIDLVLLGPDQPLTLRSRRANRVSLLGNTPESGEVWRRSYSNGVDAWACRSSAEWLAHVHDTQNGWLYERRTGELIAYRPVGPPATDVPHGGDGRDAYGE